MAEKTETQRGDKRKEALWKKIVDHIASDSKVQTSNGNREAHDESKSGGAQRGGPDIEKADERQPPDSFRRPSEEP